MQVKFYLLTKKSLSTARCHVRKHSSSCDFTEIQTHDVTVRRYPRLPIEPPMRTAYNTTVNCLRGRQLGGEPSEKLILVPVRSPHHPLCALAALLVDRRRDRAVASALVLLQTSRDRHRRGRRRKELNPPSDAQDGGGCRADKPATEQVAQQAGADHWVSDKRPNAGWFGCFST